jgi:hypothetical protein
MQIDRRYADYALTGGFFLICQVVILWALGFWPLIIGDFESWRAFLPKDTSLIAPIITGVAGALALIAVFVVGLLLDLLASLFRSIEMRTFARHLDHNRDWVSQLIESHKMYCGADYEAFERAFRGGSITSQFGLDAFMLWNPERRRRYEAAVKIAWSPNLARAYERLWSFLASYVAVMSGSSQLTIMTDQYSLWRTARTLATALWILSTEISLLILIPSVGLSYTSLISLTNAVVLLSSVGAAFLTAYITLGTYSRLCFTLFSLVYVTCDKQIGTVKAGVSGP